jgi:transposase-like protein
MHAPPTPFTPPHCPNEACPFHVDPQGWRFKKNGHHWRLSERRPVQRYRCSRCRRSFSAQTFSTTYWLKKPGLLLPVLHGLLSCSGYRQIARAQSVSPSTVALQAHRLGRHLLLFHEQHRPKDAPREPVVLDGFETFEYSQYWPTHLNTVVGAESHFVYGTTVAELRRKGRMTRKQKRRRAELETRCGRPDPRAIQKSVAEVLALVVPPGDRVITLRSDDHRDYPRALRSLRPERRFRHEVTSSKERRTTSNPLFPANLLHLLFRHGGANHKRETIAFSKRNHSMLMREAVTRVWRNFVKHRSERRKRGTPAMALGLATRPLAWEEILDARIFVTRVRLPAPLDRYYFGRVPTRQLPNAREHRLRLVV